MRNLNPDDIARMLEESRRRPPVIYKDKQTLETEELEHTKETVETEKGKYVVETTVIQTVTRYVTVREFDPESSYSDMIDDFVDPKN